MAVTITVKLQSLCELRQRIGSRRLEEDDWAILDALVSKLIGRTEARQARLIAKANQQANEAQNAATNHNAMQIANVADSSRFDQAQPNAESAAATAVVGAQCADQAATDTDKSDNTGATKQNKKRRKGHGRNGAGAFTGATQKLHALANGVIGSTCKACDCGPVTGYRDKIIIRVTGQSIFGTERNHFEQGRCKLCGAIVTAKGVESVLEGIGTSYIIYDWMACAMLIVMHYFAGAPFKRLEALHEGWGVPMPDSNQWRVVDESDDLLAPLYKALEAHGIRNAKDLSIDDTGSMIIEVQKEIRSELEALAVLGQSTENVRKGINATGVYLTTEQGKTILFFTGRHHAGEIIDKLLAHRKRNAEKLVTITDAASKNFDNDYEDELAHAVCNAHCYLKFRAVKKQFPAEYAVAGEVYKIVFGNDDKASALGLGPHERMLYHRSNSMPQMQRLLQMCKEKAESKLVEPNSPLWEPISFVIKQWKRLTMFCEVPGVPLHSNLVEQTLIIPVRYLAGSFAYKTQNGADVGDRLMSLIATANANGVEPVAYLAECLRNHEDLAKRPEYYLPWVYRERLKQRDSAEQAKTQAPPKASATRSVQHALRPGTHRDNQKRTSNAGSNISSCTAQGP